MNHLHTLAQHIATASGHNAFAAAVIVGLIWIGFNFAFGIVERLVFGNRSLYIGDVIMIVAFNWLYILVLTKINP